MTRPLRLGETVDDYCPRCRLLLTHDIAALHEEKVAMVTCRTCHNSHEFRHGQVPAKRKRKGEDNQSLMDQVLAGLPAPPTAAPAPGPPVRKRRDLWAEVERLKKK